MGPKPEVIGPNFAKLQASQAKEPKKTSFSSKRTEKSKILQNYKLLKQKNRKEQNIQIPKHIQAKHEPKETSL